MKKRLFNLLAVLLMGALLIPAIGEGDLEIMAADSSPVETEAIAGEGDLEIMTVDSTPMEIEVIAGEDDLAVSEALEDFEINAPDGAQASEPFANVVQGQQIDSERFPDEAFRKALVANYGDGQGYVDLLNLKELNVSKSGITSLKGIEYMPNLASISCFSNPIQILDLKDCPKLCLLDCSETDIETLDLTHCAQFKSLVCRDGKLSTLIAENTPLERLDISGSRVAALDVHDMSTLQYINCDGNQMGSLDVSGCVNLITLSANDNNLNTLSVNSCSALEYLHCDNNPLSALSISGLSALADLSCKGCGMSALSVADCEALGQLDCSVGKLKTLSVTGCTGLYALKCQDNAIASLTLSRYDDLFELFCQNNALAALDATLFSNLNELNCSGNQLKALDLSPCAALYRADCYDNRLTALNIDGCSALELLHAHGNPLERLDVGKSWMHGNINASEITEDSYNGKAVMTYRGDLMKGGWSDCEGWMITFDADMTLLDAGTTLYEPVDPAPPPVMPPTEPVSVELNKSGTVSLALGKTLQLKAKILPSDVETTLTWKSSKPKVASVDKSGLVTALKKGTAVITVKTANGLSAKVNIRAVAPKPTGISIANGKNATLYMGNKLTLNTKLKPANAETTLTWKSSKKAVATVSGKGVVTPKKAGTTVITVGTANNKTAKITVKVVDAKGVKLKEGKRKILKLGKKLTLHATVNPAKVKTTLTWTSSDKAVATVSQKGVVTARKAGKAVITVRTKNGKAAKITITVK